MQKQLNMFLAELTAGFFSDRFVFDLAPSALFTE